MKKSEVEIVSSFQLVGRLIVFINADKVNKDMETDRELKRANLRVN